MVAGSIGYKRQTVSYGSLKELRSAIMIWAYLDVTVFLAVNADDLSRGLVLHGRMVDVFLLHRRVVTQVRRLGDAAVEQSSG